VRSQHSDVAFQRALSLSRRQLLQLGSVGMLGLSLPDVLAAQATRSSRTARSCIFLFAWGGPSQLETWDLKPDGPPDSRGEFRPIATSVPGIQISEHFPRLSRLADKYAVIRSLTHDDPAHLSSVHHLLTGTPAPHPRSDNDGPSRRDTPHIGSVLAHLHPESALPPFVTMPPGRQHWPFCYSGILAGGGIRGGQVHGRSDRQGAYPADNPVSPGDLAATIYRALGIPPDTVLPDRMSRPVRLTHGKPILPLLG
jgi:Protein of unknown function (DUF1501)